MIMLIFVCSYFMGLAFYVLLDSYNDHHSETHFFIYYDLEDKDPVELTILLTYYCFTSLSTVGFGDFVPHSNTERIFISITLFNGVLLFSYILKGYLIMIKRVKDFNKEFEECNELQTFLKTLEHFNDATPYKKELAH